MNLRSRLRLLAATALAGAALGCAGDKTTGSNVLVVSEVEITPNGAGLTVGQTQQFAATPKTSGGTPVSGREVRWNSSNAGVASVSSTGLVTAVSVGAATITATVDQVSGNVTVTVSPVPVASVTVAPDQATILVGEATQLVATPRDDKGNPLSGRPVTWESDNPAIATVTSAGSVIGINQGSTTVRATAEGKVGSAAITVNPRPASRLGFVAQPGNGTAGQPLAPPVQVAVQDDIGRTVTTATSPITLALSDNPGGATLGGTLTVNAVQGVATFADLVLNKSASGYTLRATSAPLSPGLSNPFAIGAGVAAALAVTTQPSSSAQSGVVFVQQPVVQIKDAGGNDVAQAGVTVTAALVGSAGTLGGTLTATTAANGAATFSGLAISGPAGSYTLRFIAPGLTEVVSQPVSLSAGAATRLAIVTQPSASAQSGAPFVVQPVLQLKDANGNDAPAQGVVVTATLASGTGILGGDVTASTNATGQASFANLQITGPVGAYTIAFSAPGLTSVTSWVITLGAGGAASLEIVVQPSSTATNGVALAQQPQVRLRDASGNPVAQASITVTATLSGAGATLAGTTSLATAADGTVTFSNLSLVGLVGSYTLVFTSPGLASATSGPITLVAGAAARLAIAQQPSPAGQSGVPLAPQPTVQVVDQSGNPVGQAGVTVTAALASGAGSLGGTLTATTTGAGLASFTNLAITGPAGSYTIGFSAPGLAGVTSNSVSLGAGAATQLTISQQPSTTAQSGVAFASQPVIQLRDGSGNPVNQSGVAVTAVIASGGGTLGGTATVNTDASGVATFTNLAITGLVGSRTLRFDATSLTSATSNSISITAGAAARLGIVVQPSPTASSGVPFAQQPVIQLQDGAGNSVSQAGVGVTAAIASGTGATLDGTVIVLTDASGRATYTDLALTGTSGNFTIGFTSAGLTGATSSTVALGAGAASQLSVFTQPTSTVANGQVFPQQPVIQLRDASNNPVAQPGVPVTVTIQTGGGSLGGTLTATTDATGKATFTGLSITGTIGSRTLIFAASGYVSISSAPVNVIAGPATALAIATPPSATAASGIAFPQQPAIQLVDQSGNLVSQSGINIGVAIATGGGTLSGTTPVATNASGLASFTNLAITGTAGPRTLSFTSGSLASVTSGTISVTAGAASQLTITTQPSSSAQSGLPFLQQPVIQLRDASGNPVSQAGVNVTAAIASGGGTLGGTVIVATNGSGVATFTDLAITGTVGTRTLSFSATGLTGATSGSINLTAGTATQLTITTQPSGTAQSGVALAQQPVVQLSDGAGNPVSQGGVSVTAAVAPATATLGGTVTVTTSTSGVATFTNLVLTGTAGSYTLQFSATGLTSATSGTITLTAGAAATIQMFTQPSSTAQSGVVLATQPVVKVLDANNNNVSGVTVTASVSGGATLGGTVTATSGSNGRASFTNLSITGTVGSYTLSFSAPGATSATSNSISLSAGAASQITITTQPSGTARSGIPLGTVPTAHVTDGGGNPIAGVTVTATLNGGGTLSGTTSGPSDASGDVTFTGLTITGTVGATRSLTFSAAGPTPVNSNNITLSAGAATQLGVTTQPGTTSAVNGQALSPQPAVHLLDAQGNPLDSAGASVTAVIASGSGVLAGTMTVSTSGTGTATFTDLAITGTAGAYTLRFDATSLASATSSPFTLTAGAATQLVLITDVPGTAVNGVTFSQSPVIEARDGSGNPVTGVSITAAIATGTGTLNGTITVSTGSNGQATFSGLSIVGTDGDFALTFTAGALSVGSGTTTLSAGAATQIAISTQPSATATSGSPLATQPVIQFLDSGGNLVTSATGTVTATLVGSGGTLGGTVSLAATGGVVTFTDLVITGPGTYTLQFDSTGFTAVQSTSITVN